MSKYKSRKRLDNALLNMAIGFLFLVILFILWMAWNTKKAEASREPLVRPQFYVYDSSLPTPTPTPALPPGVEEIIRFNFRDLGERVVQEAIKVFRCESGLRENAYNGKNKDKSNDSGVAQINSIHKVPARFLKSAEVNVAVARVLYDEQGWGPWYSSYKCHGLK
jgi:hypothetical protein